MDGQKMHILVTNDDGIQAPGLLALAQAVGEIGKVTVFAPDRNWSASGHVKTMDRPLRVRETQLADGTPAFASDGAPSDCVALPLLGLVQKKVDLVVSGINPNANIGHDVTDNDRCLRLHCFDTFPLACEPWHQYCKSVA